MREVCLILECFIQTIEKSEFDYFCQVDKGQNRRTIVLSFAKRNVFTLGWSRLLQGQFSIKAIATYGTHWRSHAATSTTLGNSYGVSSKCTLPMPSILYMRLDDLKSLAKKQALRRRSTAILRSIQDDSIFLLKSSFLFSFRFL